MNPTARRGHHPPEVAGTVCWRANSAGSVRDLLIFGPGPSPFLSESWLRYVALSSVHVGGWGIMCRTSLAPVPELSAAKFQEHDSLGSTTDEITIVEFNLDGRVRETRSANLADLYERLRWAATGLAGRRLADPVVADSPESSGILTARLRASGATIAVEVAPAKASLDASRVSAAFPLLSPITFEALGDDNSTVWSASRHIADADITEREVEVSLSGSRDSAAKLPAVLMRWTGFFREGTQYIARLALPMLSLPAVSPTSSDFEMLLLATPAVDAIKKV